MGPIVPSFRNLTSWSSESKPTRLILSPVLFVLCLISASAAPFATVGLEANTPAQLPAKDRINLGSRDALPRIQLMIGPGDLVERRQGPDGPAALSLERQPAVSLLFFFRAKDETVARTKTGRACLREPNGSRVRLK